jgi:hypothetical protein
MTQHHKQYVSTHHHMSQTANGTEIAEASELREAQSGESVGCDDIRLCAYQKWEEAGKPSGDGVEFWLEAEHELVHAK